MASALPNPTPALPYDDTEGVLAALSMLSFMRTGRTDLAEELANVTPTNQSINGLLSVAYLLLDELKQASGELPLVTLAKLRAKFVADANQIAPADG